MSVEISPEYQTELSKHEEEQKRKEAPKPPEKKEREPAPIPERLQEVLIELGDMEEAEEKIQQHAQEISEVLNALDRENERENRIYEKLGQELLALQETASKNLDRILRLKEEERAILDAWALKERALSLAEELDIPGSAAEFLVVGDNPELLSRAEELKEVMAATPEEVGEMLVGAAAELKKEEKIEIDASEFEKLDEERRKELEREAEAAERVAERAEKDAQELEKRADKASKEAEKQLKDWSKRGLDVEAEERSWAGAAKLSMRRLLKPKFNIEYMAYEQDKEEAIRLWDEAVIARFGARGRNEEAKRLRECLASGDLKCAARSLSTATLKRALRSQAGRDASRELKEGKPVLTLS